MADKRCHSKTKVLFLYALSIISYSVNLTEANNCTSYECQRASNEFLSSMDFSVDPCHDFYQYTCGNWLKNHPLPNDTTRHSWVEIIDTDIMLKVQKFLQMNDSDNEAKPEHQARAMFKTCMDTVLHEEQGYEPLFELLNELTLPSVPTFFQHNNSKPRSEHQFNWTTSIVQIKKSLNLEVLINLRVYPDLETSNSTVTVNKILLEFPSKQKLDSNETDIIDEITNLLKAASNSSIIEEQQLIKINESATVITTIQEQLKEIIKQTKSAIPDLQQPISDTVALVLQDFLDVMFDGMPEHVKVKNSSDEVYISFPDYLYFQYITNLTQDLSHQDIELYIWWTVVENARQHTHVHWFYDNRMDYCTNELNKLMGMAISGAIIDQEFLKVSKPKIETIFLNVREAFKQIVLEVDWMDEHTKNETLQKIEHMQAKIGFPEWLLNKTALAEYYEGITVNKTSHLMNLVEVNRWKMRNMLLDWRVTPKLKWTDSPTTVNAFYVQKDNSITIPLAYLQYPNYYLGLDSLTYGSMGWTLGHEMTHGFDETGRMFDKNGNYNKVWGNNETSQNYDKKVDCFINQYGKYSIPEVDDSFINGSLTLDENIADNGGFRKALMAYRLSKVNSKQELLLPGFEDFTDEQLFFISFANRQCEIYTETEAEEQLADEHAPAKVRVNVVLSNSDDFKKTFHCKDGSGMLPVEHEQCILW